MEAPVTEDRKACYCKVCGNLIIHAQVDEDGLCGPCGLRFRMNKLPPAGAYCVLCGERRRRNLTTWALSGDPVCYGCEFHLKETRPYPENPLTQKSRLRRDRRRAFRWCWSGE